MRYVSGLPGTDLKGAKQLSAYYHRQFVSEFNAILLFTIVSVQRLASDDLGLHRGSHTG